MGTANKDRQAAFKERMRLAGKRQVTVWVDSSQETAIKAVLEGTVAVPTPALVARVEEIERQEQAARNMLDAANQRELQILEAKRRLEDREDQLDEREQRLQNAPRKQPSMSNTERTAALVERFTTTTSWSNGTRRDLDAGSTERHAQVLTSLTRQTKAARTALASIEKEFSELLNLSETSILADARGVLASLGDAATHAKEKTHRILAERKRIEEERAKAAAGAVAKLFGEIDVPDQVCLMAFVDRHNNYFQLLQSRRDLVLRDYVYYLNNGVEAAITSLRWKVESGIKEGKAALDAAEEIRSAFDLVRAGLATQYAGMIGRLQAALVQSRLEKVANGV